MKVQILKVFGIRYTMKQKNTVIYKIKNQKLDICIMSLVVTSKQTKHEVEARRRIPPKPFTVC